jgi:DNA repair photolyase
VFVRWSNLTLGEDEQRSLPGYREEAIVRRFKAPDALETRFYEVRAKSALNRVPKASRMPFRWTVNPYRGCTHACVYCIWGGTPVLMGDARHKPMAELEVGDVIYGTVRRGRYRRYERTRVLAKWASVKPAHRITLADGTELIASGDHRFLSNRGWKHVTGAESGPEQRPHLTVNNWLVGTGRFAEQPAETDEYSRGYLTGIVRGDGTFWSHSYERRDRGGRHARGFRLALTDLEALRRARRYLDEAAEETRERVFQVAAGSRREMLPIETGQMAQIERVRALIAWPARPTLDWIRGFLAGIFDAEGSRSCFALRIANTDTELLMWVEMCLGRLRFEVSHDRTHERNGLTCLRIRGGLSEHLRFMHLTDPAITRKRSIEGQMVKTFANLRVVSIEDLGTRLPMYDITTGTGDFIADGVVSHNCFARPTHTYLDFDAGRDFEREIVVKVNAPEVLRAELARPSWRGEHVALGTNTDPYQWVEGRYRLMEGIWEALRDAANPCSVLTKSPLLLRDLPLMLQIAERTSFGACLSIPTLDEKVWRETEPHTPNPRARLEAVAELNRAGIPTGILIAPLMPGVNDAPQQLEPLLELAGAAGATSIGGVALHLRGAVREIFMDWLRCQRPELAGRYEQLYRRGAYAPRAERERLSQLVRWRGSPGGFASLERRFGAGAGDRPSRPARSRPPIPAPSGQTTLF